jgi:hypothetical protein
MEEEDGHTMFGETEAKNGENYKRRWTGTDVNTHTKRFF